MQSRTNNSLLNILTALAGQGLSTIVAFIARLVFIRTLSQEYLGLSGVFSNILTMLSLAELGIGPAMTFAMYEPLSRNDGGTMKALMKIYKKAYVCIGTVIFGAGVAFLPVYSYFITTDVYIPNLDLIYILYVINTVISYFFSYKRSILEADQKKFYCNIVHYLAYIGMNVVQSMILLFYKDYIVYLLVQILFTFMENLIVAKIADQRYGYLKSEPDIPLNSSLKKSIWKNVKAMIFHKIGTVIVQSTDSLLLSKFIGLVASAIYANYSLVINAVSTVISQIFSNLTASVGNLSCTESNEKINIVFKRIWFMNVWLFGFASICFVCVFQIFIKVFFGKDYLFHFFTVLMLSLRFYTSGMRQTVNVFKDANGLFYKDWFKPVVESLVNLAVSIILLRYIGAAGIFLGTVISNVFVSTWIEGFVVCNYVLHQKLSWYLKMYLKAFCLTAVICIVALAACNCVSGNGGTVLVARIFISVIISNLLYWCVYHKSEEFIYYKMIFKSLLRKKG